MPSQLVHPNEKYIFLNWASIQCKNYASLHKENYKGFWKLPFGTHFLESMCLLLTNQQAWPQLQKLQARSQSWSNLRSRSWSRSRSPFDKTLLIAIIALWLLIAIAIFIPILDKVFCSFQIISLVLWDIYFWVQAN